MGLKYSYVRITFLDTNLFELYSTIHKAACLTAPGCSMALIGTIPVEQKLSIGCEWELATGTVIVIGEHFN